MLAPNRNLVNFVVALVLVVPSKLHSQPPIPTASSTYLHIAIVQQGVSSITANGWHTCALVWGEAMCWGWNQYGQLGDGTTANRSSPVSVSGLASASQAIAAGDYHTCALLMSDGIKCWGDNRWGQLGDGTTDQSVTPVNVSGLSSGVSAIAAGGAHTCALSSGGVKCWGDNFDGQVGDGTTTNRYTPVDVNGLNNGIVAIAAGGSHTCALTTDGGVKCWGNNVVGQLGDGTTVHRYTPVDVSGLSNGVVAITAGNFHTCALTNIGAMKCWGENYHGALGDGTTTNRFTPVSVNGLASGVIAIAAGGGHTCAVTGNGGVKCWGDNYYGGIGDGTTIDRYVPVDVSGLTTGAVAVTAGLSHTCALTDSVMRCWGSNGSGELGDGTTTHRYTPVDVIGLGSSPIVGEARIDIGMPYNANRGCASPYIGCDGPYHGFYKGVCTDLVLDSYNAGAPFNIQNALYQDYRANPGRYRYGSARNAEDMRRYFSYNQSFLSHSQPYQQGDIAFFDWDGDGLTNHVLVISEVDASNRPLKMVDASGVIPNINPSGLAFEHDWSDYYEQHIQGHARLSSNNLATTATLTETLQILRVTVDSSPVGLSLFDSNGKSVSEIYDENLVANNIEASIPYIPGGSYASLSTQKVITVTQPLSNTNQYFVRVEGQANTTYTLLIETLQDASVTASQTFTQAIGAGEIQNAGITITAPSEIISFTTQSPTSSPFVNLPSSLSLGDLVGTSAQLTFTISETGGQQAIDNASVTATDLSTQYGIKILSSQLTITPTNFSVAAGSNQQVGVQVSLTDLNPGEYLGSFILTSQSGSPMMIPFTLQVQYHTLYLPLVIRN